MEYVRSFQQCAWLIVNHVCKSQKYNTVVGFESTAVVPPKFHKSVGMSNVRIDTTMRSSKLASEVPNSDLMELYSKVLKVITFASFDSFAKWKYIGCFL